MKICTYCYFYRGNIANLDMEKSHVWSGKAVLKNMYDLISMIILF